MKAQTIKITELQIERAIYNWLDLYKFNWWPTKIKGEPHMSKDGRMFMKRSKNAGFPDILCCIDGKFVTIEVKRPGNKQTEYQIEQEYKIKRAFGIYILAYCVEDVINGFKQRGFI